MNSWFGNISVNMKLGLGFGLVLALTCVLALIGWTSLGGLIDRSNWILGEDVVNPAIFPTGALRSLQDPHNGGSSLNDPGFQPKHVNEQYSGTNDNGGVHINSGIPNHAFYLFIG
mgnify:CR=1 FL=1